MTTAVTLSGSSQPVAEATGCQHIEYIVRDIQRLINPDRRDGIERLSSAERDSFINEVARANVLHTVAIVREQSQTLDGLLREGRIAIVGAMYDVATGRMTFLSDGAAR